MMSRREFIVSTICLVLVGLFGPLPLSRRNFPARRTFSDKIRDALGLGNEWKKQIDLVIGSQVKTSTGGLTRGPETILTETIINISRKLFADPDRARKYIGYPSISDNGGRLMVR